MHMYKIKNIMSKLIIIFSIITMLFSGKSYATEVIRDENGKATVVVTVEDAANATSGFAKNFNSYYGSETEYGYGNSYDGEKIEEKYQFNESSFIEFVIHNSLGTDYQGEISLNTLIISPGDKYEYILGGNTPGVALDKEKVKAEVLPGDLLFGVGGESVAIYVGGDIIYSAPGDANTALHQISLYPENGETRTDFNNYCAVARITESAAHELVASNVTTLFMQNDDDDKYNKYYGTTEGRYVGSYSFNLGDWLFNGFVGFLDYLIGILFYIVKAPFLGWANIVENWINDNINLISGISFTDVSDITISEEGYTPDARDVRLLKRVNVEDIIYNNVPLLDIDIFDVGLSKYQNEYITISEDSILYKLKDNIAAWYFGIRNISIVGMLLVLVYLGIRLAISVTGEKKARYKQMLVAWATSFAAIFFIHFFMIIAIECNNVLIDWFKDQNLMVTNGLSLYETIRTRAYAIKLSESLPATFMYITLVYFLIKFLFVYIRRYFTVNILALMAPVMCVKNAIDKISKGKSGTMSAWMYDFALNVLLQSLHAIIYTVYMSQAYTFSTQSVAGFVLALIFMNYIFKAEALFIRIFRFDDAKSLRDVKEGRNYITDGFKAAVGIGYYSIGITKFGFGFVRNTTKVVDFAGQGVLQAGADIINKVSKGKFDIDIAEIDEKRQKERREMLNDAIQDLTGQRSLRLDLENLKDSDPILYLNAKNILDTNKKLKSTAYSRSLKNGVNSVKNMFALLTGTAAIVVDPKVGISAFTTTLLNIGDSANRKTRYGHRTGKQIAGKVGRIGADFVTLGAYGTLANNLKSNNEQLQKIAKTENQLNDMRKADTLAVEIEKQTKELEANILPEDKDTFEEIKRQMIKSSLDSVLYGKNIKSAVKDYMFKNNLTKINSSDIEGIMREFNLSGIEKDIKSLTKTEEYKIESLLKEAEELKEVVNNAAKEVSEEESDKKAKEKLKASEQKLERTEKKIEKVKKELEVIKQIHKKLQQDPELADGLYIDIKEAIREYKYDNKSENGGINYLVDSDVDKVIEKYKKEKYVGKARVEAKIEKENSKHKRQKEQPVKKEKENVTNIFLDAIAEEGGRKKNIEEIRDKVEAEFNRKANKTTTIGKHNMFVAGKTKEIFENNPEMYDLAKKMRELKTLNEKHQNKYGESLVSMGRYSGYKKKGGNKK